MELVMGASASRSGARAPHQAPAGLDHTASPPRAAGVEGYRRGECRNSAAYGLNVKSHTYAMMSEGGLLPMCGYGWNRSGGDAFSIFRSAPGSEGNCKLCRKNVAAGKPPVMDGFPHKTKWL